MERAMATLTPGLKADLCLIFEELSLGTSGLLNTELSAFHRWCDDRAIDLDCLYGYISVLCVEQEVSYQELRSLTTKLLRSDATIKQLWEQVATIAPGLLEELCTQASLASSELGTIQKDAGGTHVGHWMAKHPVASSTIALGGTAAAVTLVIRAGNKDGHHDALDGLNERVVESANSQAERVVDNATKEMSEAMQKEFSDIQRKFNNDLASGKDVLRSDMNSEFRKKHWTIDEDATALMGAHFDRWPEQRVSMERELARPLLRKLHPREYLAEFKRWEREEGRKVKSDISDEEANVSDTIEEDRYKLKKFEKEEVLKAEEELYSIEAEKFQLFDKSEHSEEFIVKVLAHPDNRLRCDFNGMAQKAYHKELHHYYKLDNAQYFDENGLNGTGTARPHKDIIERNRLIDSPEVKAFRKDCQEEMFKYGKYVASQKFYDHIVYDSFIGKTPEERLVINQKFLENFGGEDNMNKWLESQPVKLPLKDGKRAESWAQVNIDKKVSDIGSIVDNRVRVEYQKVRIEARATLERISNKAEADLTSAERDLKEKALKDIKDSDLLARFFTRELDRVMTTIKSEALELVDKGEKDVSDAFKAGEEKADNLLITVT
jgi:hypothetical protein